MYEVDEMVYPEDDELFDSQFRSDFGGGAERLFNCDVCCTCSWFDHMRNKCRYIGNMYWVRIKSPHVFRCSYWEEKKSNGCNY
jgi:hypothetical protein